MCKCIVYCYRYRFSLHRQQKKPMNNSWISRDQADDWLNESNQFNSVMMNRLICRKNKLSGRIKYV